MPLRVRQYVCPLLVFVVEEKGKPSHVTYHSTQPHQLSTHYRPDMPGSSSLVFSQCHLFDCFGDLSQSELHDESRRGGVQVSHSRLGPNIRAARNALIP
jgi:hypothetical protein